MVWSQNSSWSSLTSRNGRDTSWIITSNPSQISTRKHKAYGHQPVSSSVGAQTVHFEGEGAPSSPLWVSRSHIPGRSQLCRIGCSCIVMVPPPTIPWNGTMEWLCSLLRTSLFKNKQAKVSLIWPIFNSGRRQPVPGWGVGKEARRQANTLRTGTTCRTVCRPLKTEKWKESWASMGCGTPRSSFRGHTISFLRFSCGISDRLLLYPSRS